jgi:hypothetical protein
MMLFVCARLESAAQTAPTAPPTGSTATTAACTDAAPDESAPITFKPSQENRPINLESRRQAHVEAAIVAACNRVQNAMDLAANISDHSVIRCILAVGVDSRPLPTDAADLDAWADDALAVAIATNIAARIKAGRTYDLPWGDIYDMLGLDAGALIADAAIAIPE